MSNLKYTYETKIKFLDDEIKLMEEYITWNKKTSSWMMLLGISCLIIIAILQCVTEKTITTLDIILISIMTTSIYSLISNYFEEQHKMKHDLKLAKIHRDNLIESMQQLDDLSKSNEVGV